MLRHGLLLLLLLNGLSSGLHYSRLCSSSHIVCYQPLQMCANEKYTTCYEWEEVDESLGDEKTSWIPLEFISHSHTKPIHCKNTNQGCVKRAKTRHSFNCNYLWLISNTLDILSVRIGLTFSGKTCLEKTSLRMAPHKGSRVEWA